MKQTNLKTRRTENMDTERLIDLVKSHSILYDLSHKDYQNYGMKLNVWNSIAEEMDKRVDIVKAKWKSLRDGYTKYRKSIKNLKTFTKKTPEYIWRSHLSFLDEYNTYIRMPSTAEPHQDSDNSHSLQSTQSNMSPLPSIPQLESTTVTPELPLYHLTYPQNQRLKRSYVDEDDDDEPLQNYQTKKTKVDHDSIDHLFLSYAKTFKRFPPRERVLLKLELAKLFANTELNLLGCDDTLDMKSEDC